MPIFVNHLILERYVRKVFKGCSVGSHLYRFCKIIVVAVFDPVHEVYTAFHFLEIFSEICVIPRTLQIAKTITKMKKI